jgi:hypothetical protein
VTAAGGGDEPAPIAWRTLGREWRAPQYPSEQMTEEAAFIAYHFHWDIDRIYGLEHAERRRWAHQISRINGEINEQRGALSSV